MAIAPKPVGAFKRRARQLGGMASLALAPLLLLQLATLWLVRNGAEFEVPEFVAARLRPHLKEAGIACTWSSARISLSGRIALTDAAVGTAGAAEPVFEAGRLTAVLDPFDLIFSRRITPLHLWLDRGRLICPPSISPTGRREVALDRVRAALHREGDRLIIDTLQADCAGVPLVAHGRVLPPRSLLGPKYEQAKPEVSLDTPPHPLRAPGVAAARIVSLRPWLSRLENASLELRGDDTPDGIRLALTGLADAINLPEEGVRAESLHLRFGLIWEAAGPRPADDAVFGFRTLAVDRPASGAMQAIVARCGTAELRTAFGPEWQIPTAARITAHRPEVNRVALDRLSILGERAGDKIRLLADINWRRENASVDALLDPRAGTLAALFDAHVRPDTLLTHPLAPGRDAFPSELDGFSIPALVDASGSVTLDAGWRFREALVRAETGRFNLAPVALDAVRLRARVTPDTLCIPEIELEAPGQHAIASVETGYTAKSRYRILVKANAYPGQVRPFVGKWWDRIWADLALTPGHPAFVDLDVFGQWDGLPYENIFARFCADKLIYRKQVFDRVSVRLLEQPEPVHRISIHDLRMTNADGTHATGALEWRYAAVSPSEHKRESCRFHFAGRLSKDVGVQIAGDEVVTALAEVKLKEPAEGEVIGRYHGVMSASPGRDQLEVRIRSAGPFEAWRLPGENFCGTVLLDDRRIEVKNAALRYAGGDTKGRAWIHLDPAAYRLSFEADFKDCDRTAFFAGIAGMKAPAPAAPPKPPKKDEPPAPPAFISGDIKARVILPDMATFDAKGHAAIRDPGMPSVPVLGAFSRGLESMGVEAATYRFDTVDGQFFIRDNAVWCPDLKIRGKDAVVDVRGKYVIGPGDIAFRAMLIPNKADKIPVLDWAKNILTSSTKLFPVDVTGTLDDPKWKVDPTPSAIFTKQVNDSLGLPPPPKPDDGRW